MKEIIKDAYKRAAEAFDALSNSLKELEYNRTTNQIGSKYHK